MYIAEYKDFVFMLNYSIEYFLNNLLSVKMSKLQIHIYIASKYIYCYMFILYYKYKT